MSRTVYRVTVEATEYDDEGGVLGTAVLFDAGSPSATRLYSFVPQQVELALAEVSGAPVPATVHRAVAYDATASTPTAIVASTTPDGPTVEVPATPMDPFPVPPEGKPKRTRRTKAQIAADEAAAREAANGAQVADPTQAAAPPNEPGVAPLTLVPPLPAAEPAPLMTQPHDTPAGSVPVVGQQPAAPPEAPYNPFMS